MSPIIICSKGRPESTTISMCLLEVPTSDFIIVVEEQDYESYRNVWGNLVSFVVLDKNDMGLPYARNKAIQWADNAYRRYEPKWKKFWMLDDDIQGFYVNGKDEIRLTECLEAVEKQFEGEELAQIGLEYKQYSWAAKEEKKYNSYCNACTLFNLDVIGDIRHDEKLYLWSDKDFNLQCIANKKPIARSLKYSFQTFPCGKEEGGLYEDYRTKKREDSMNLMLDKWSCCKKHERKKGVDLKVNWKSV